MASAYSPSRIGTYENCPLKFKFRYVERRPSVRSTIEAFLGSRVHDALEKLYKDLRFKKELSLEELLAYYWRRWDQEINDQVHVVKEGYDRENYRRMGEAYLTQYYHHYHPFDQGKTVALEKLIMLPLGEGYVVRGYIDRLTDRDGVYEIHDYKTSMTLPTKEDIATDRQLSLYALAVKHAYEAADEIALVWHYMAFDQEIRIPTTPSMLEAVRQETIAKIKGIEAAIAANAFPAQHSALCPYCEYQEFCPLFKHELQVEKLPPHEARAEDGRVLVNQYAEVDSKIKELERLRNELKDRIVTYAQSNDMQYVYGTGQIANVKIYKNPWFPNRKDPQRGDLERLLKELGVYQEFAKLDTIALSKAYEHEKLPDDLQRHLEKFVSEKTVSRIYLRERTED
jgi:putative RecB family exonuclease